MTMRLAKFGRLFFALMVMLGLTLTLGGHASADESGAGWYGPYSDGCSYYWDGYAWTGDQDCAAASATSSASGYTAGWYDANGDGCLYYYDGAQYTGASDCSATSSAAAAAGWYGPYSDGCYYWWDGAAWTGDLDCTTATQAGAAAGWYGPYGDGCNYYWDGSQWSGAPVCTAATSSTQSSAAGWYGPYSDGCFYQWDGANWTGAKTCVTSEGVIIGTAAPTTANTDTTVAVITDGGSTGLFPEPGVADTSVHTTGCGDFCEPNFGNILAGQLAAHPVSAAELAKIAGPELVPVGSLDCAYVLGGYCYSN